MFYITTSFSGKEGGFSGTGICSCGTHNIVIVQTEIKIILVPLTVSLIKNISRQYMYNVSS